MRLWMMHDFLKAGIHKSSVETLELLPVQTQTRSKLFTDP